MKFFLQVIVIGGLLFSVNGWAADELVFETPKRILIGTSGDSEEGRSVSVELSAPTPLGPNVGAGFELGKQSLDGEESIDGGGFLFIQNPDFSKWVYHLGLWRTQVDDEVLTRYADIMVGSKLGPFKVLPKLRLQKSSFETLATDTESSKTVEVVGTSVGLSLQMGLQNWRIGVYGERSWFDEDLTLFTNESVLDSVPDGTLQVFPSFSEKHGYIEAEYYFQSWILGITLFRSRSAVYQDLFRGLELRSGLDLSENWFVNVAVSKGETADTDSSGSDLKSLSVELEYQWF